METIIIITLCVLLLSAYVFDISSSRTRIPPVILLLGLGYLVKRGTDWLGFHIPDLTPLLPFLGSIGLILIVLEGALELQLDRSKLPMIGRSSLIAVLPMIVLMVGLGAGLYYSGGISIQDALVNAVPFAVISSSIAIPSAANLGAVRREFVIYESSLSDIFGVLFFNFVLLNEDIGIPSVGYFVLDLLLTLLITGIASLALAFLLSKIRHHVKFVPIIISVILVYEIAKVFHLPGLIFIMIFGMFLGNLDELRNIPYIHYLHPEVLTREMPHFRELTGELTFLVRGLFFLLFGFTIRAEDLLDTDTLIWSASISAAIFILRFIVLRSFRVSVFPLLWIAPRGLITILLFLSIPESQTSPMITQPVIIQVILITALVMMFGLMAHKPEKKPVPEKA